MSRVLRVAAFSGMLGMAGLMATAGPAHAQEGSDTTTEGSDTVETTTTSTTVVSSDVGAETTTSRLAETGGDAAVPLALGGTAIAIVVAGRRFLSKV